MFWEGGFNRIFDPGSPIALAIDCFIQAPQPKNSHFVTISEMWFVYILLCEDNSLYTGISNNVQKRFLDHQNGKGGKYTRSRKVIKIVYQEQLSSKSEALKRELEIKSWKRIEKIYNLRLTIAE